MMLLLLLVVMVLLLRKPGRGSASLVSGKLLCSHSDHFPSRGNVGNRAFSGLNLNYRLGSLEKKVH